MLGTNAVSHARDAVPVIHISILKNVSAMKRSKELEKKVSQRELVQEMKGAKAKVHDEVDPSKPMISGDLLVAFERFYEFHPARRLSRNLRSMLLEFLMYDGSNEAAYLRDLVSDLGGLFSLLDAMEEERAREIGCPQAGEAYF